MIILNLNQKTIDRFWSKVDIKDKDECWNWNAAMRPNGYGQFSVNKYPHKSHRISYILTYGEIPDGKVICHNCANRRCVNPFHLRADTQKENIREARRLGAYQNIKQVKGTECPSSKLSEKDVIEIKKLLSTKISQWDIARLFNVRQCTISDIKLNKTWKHLNVKS